MEKITKEELLENLGGTPLSDDELEQVANEIEESEKMFDENGEFINEEDNGTA